ncbi:MAG TPA: tetratricopeptide repeat protein [Verrucomicrobiae bacterium]|jgi:tetratricopeptide (TPR) repeat protein|nr:tetratricopeptide repeat protein [Verrucomicrobiae bacterium]
MEVGTGITPLDAGRRFSLSETARILEVPAARLRALARAGFLAPQRGPIGPLSFGFQDLLLLRTTRGLVEAGVPMRRIRRMWASLREQLAAEPLTSITVHADGDEIVATDGSGSWRPDSGQVLLNFETSELVERAADLPASGRRRNATRADLAVVADAPGDAAPAAERRLSAEEWYEIGCELETSAPDRARDAYEHALALDPLMADAHVNLGRVLHVAGERGRAEPHYRQAVKLDPDDPTPHFNLGVLFEEVGRKEEAVLAYRQAIVRDPDFADAHCNLGLLLESLGRRQEALRHLMTARQLNESEE